MAVGLSPELNEELTKTGSSDLVEVVLELHRRDTSAQAAAGGLRSEKIAALKESFNRDADPVEEMIRSVGGEVTGRAWINQTVRARVPAQKIKQLAAHEKVRTVDLPHPLTPDRA
jgi:hypothetical protein